MKKRLPISLLDEAEMRAFYASCGVSKSTTEAAIKLRLSQPVEGPKKALPSKGKRKRNSPKETARVNGSH